MASLDAPEDQGLGATQMHDAAIDAGIVETPTVEFTIDEINLNAQEEAERRKEFEHDNKSLSELEELEDDLDDEIYRKLRENRVKQLKQQKTMESNIQNSNSAAARIIEINEEQFDLEVKEASRYSYVLLLIYNPNNPDCLRLLSILVSLASQLNFNSIKFVKMKVSDRILNFPSSDCPALLAYKNCVKVKQWSKLDSFAGRATNNNIVEWELSEAGIIQTELSENPCKTLINNAFKTNIKKGNKLTRRDYSSEDEDEEDEV